MPFGWGLLLLRLVSAVLCCEVREVETLVGGPTYGVDRGSQRQSWDGMTIGLLNCSLL